MAEACGTNDRAGVGSHILQPAGHRAFVSAPLLPQPPIRMMGSIQALLSTADRALGRLGRAIYTLPEADLFVLMYLRKEIMLSSQIEGTPSPLRDMCGGRSTPGELRRSQNWIDPADCTLRDAVFVPSPFEEAPRALDDLETFLHRDNDLPPLGRIGLTHTLFETIQPFPDSNGRLGQLLTAFFLCEKKIFAKPVLYYLSHFFKRHWVEYYDRLQAVRDAGDWSGWLAFFLCGVAEVDNEAITKVRRILNLRKINRAVTDWQAADSDHRVLEVLYRTPVVTDSDRHALP